MAAVRPLAVAMVRLDDACGRVLAADAFADLPQPDFDRAMMDGIAVVAADCASLGSVLEVVGEAPAGTHWSGTLRPGQAVRIMTGAPVPAGADAVVPVERIEPATAGAATVGGRWRVNEVVRAEQHIARRGSEVAVGARVGARGERLGGTRIGALAAFGHARVEVYRRPVVAILPTGDELVDVHHKPAPGQVRDSNRHALTALVRQAGGVAQQQAVAGDSPGALRAAMERGLAEADVVVLSGGVSMGDYDLVGSTLADLGARVLFHRVAIRPGKPLLVATVGDRLVFGLPGNPVSSYVCAALFLRPALAALQGARCRDWQVIAIPCAQEMPAVGPRESWFTGRLGAGPEGLHVHPVSGRGSADMVSFAVGDHLIRRPAHAPVLAAGGLVDVLFWPEQI